jgi:hypothetical protein
MRVQRNVSFNAGLDKELESWVRTKRENGAELSKKDVFNAMIWAFLNQLSEDDRINSIRAARDLSLTHIRQIGVNSANAALATHNSATKFPAEGSEVQTKAGGQRLKKAHGV